MNRSDLMRMTKTVSLLLAVAALGACWEDDRDYLWERERQVLGPIPLKDGVAYVDSGLDRVVSLDLSEEAPRLSVALIGRRAIYATPTPAKDKLLVITRGEEAVVEGQIDQDPALWVVDIANPGAPVQSYSIGSPFDRLAIADDASLAVAYFSGTGPDSDGFFRNPNELAFIDLAQPESDTNPLLKTVRSFGAVPDGIVLSPPMTIPGAEDDTPRIFAFVLAPNNLTVVDATNPERNEVSIRLDIDDEPVRPREIVFAPNTATAYLRSDNARDVLEIIITPEPPATASAEENDYRPVLAELGAGGGPSDIAVYDDATGHRFVLAATPNTGEIVVIDADTAQFRTVATSDPIDRILLFPNGGGAVPQKAVMASVGARLPRLHVLELGLITDELVQIDLDAIDLEEPVLDIVPVPGREMAMIIHDDNRTVLGLLDMAFGSVSPLQGIGKLDVYAFTPDGTHLVGATNGVETVGYLELDNLHPSDMRLDDVPSRVFALDNGRIFVDHADPLGRATIIPYAGADRDESLVMSGFLLEGYLDVEGN
jgi:hypothetical protein